MTDAPYDWHRVKMELHQCGMTLTELARIHNVHASAFTNLGKRANYKAQKIIAEFLDKPEALLFPDRYPTQKTRILNTKVAAKEKARVRAREAAA